MPPKKTTSHSSVYHTCTSDYASSSSHISYDPCLKQDLATERELSVEDFTRLIFGVDDWAKVVESSKVKDISENSKLKTLLKEYDESTQGADLYRHFIVLANHILAAGTPETSSSIAFVLNGPVAKTRLHRTLVPNAFVAGAPFSDRQDGGLIEVSEESPFQWADIRCYLEIKLPDDREEWTTASGYSSGSTFSNKRSSSSSGKSSRSSTKRSRAEEWSESSSKRCRGGVSDMELKLRCASHALEMLSSDGLRTHALGLYIDDHNLHVHYFDRSIFISSASFCFKGNPNVLIALILTLQGLDNCQWGFVPGFNRPVISQSPNSSCTTESRLDKHSPTTLTLSGGWTLELYKTLSRQRAQIGRGTVVVRVRITEAPPPHRNQTAVIKISSPARSRRNEKDILQLAYEKATGEFERMLAHLPRMSYGEDIDLGTNSCREKLSAFFDNDINVYEARALRFMVFSELQPLQGLLTTQELSKALRDIFGCYKWLCEEVKILHRDISLYNMMYYRTKDGQVRGVLNDFDLATVIGESSPTSKQRTGTKPFMAHELLLNDETPHLYRHDLESFFYVILILTTHFENGKEVADPPYNAWFTLDSRTLACRKNNVLLGGICYPLHPMTPPYSAFIAWLQRMRYMFQQGMQMRPLDEAPPDAETLGGHITLEKMAEIFDVELCADDPPL